MSLMIDPPAVPSRGRMWSHLASDTSYDELHAFAREHWEAPARANLERELAVLGGL